MGIAKHNLHLGLLQKTLLFFACLFAISACEEKVILPPKDDLLNFIKKRGKIRACTHYNSIDYFVYKGEPMGFQLELIEAFAKKLKVKAEFVVDKNLSASYAHLKDGSCDVIASNLTITPERLKSMDFAKSFYTTRQVLVQRKPLGWEKMSEKKLNSMLIRGPMSWKYDTIYVQENSSYCEQLHFLKEKVGIPLHIVADSENEAEQLIAMVANGEIKYTIVVENIARVNQAYYPNLDFTTQIASDQKLAWAIRKTSLDFKDTINDWMKNFMKTKDYKILVEKYFINQRSIRLLNSEFNTKGKGVITPYDKILRRVSAKYHWDWRLLASLIYQESHFIVSLEGWSGCFGIMQLMPSTAKNYGIVPGSSAEKQIEGGAKYIHYLDKLIPKEVDNPLERMKFVVASYNSGPGHVLDAIELAKKYHKDPKVWEHNVDTFLVLKSKAHYYNDAVVKSGFYRGVETLRFVNEVLERYKHYKNIAH